MSFTSLLFAFFPGDIAGILIPTVTMVMVFSIPIVAIITEHFTKKARMRLYEEALRNGVPLEDLPLDNEKSGTRLPFRSGMITCAVGVGVIFFGLTAGSMLSHDGELTYFLGAGGVITLLVGISLLINDFIHREHLYARLREQNEQDKK